ncbi:MAG: hypothetical protein ACFWTJ_09605 [Lachnoclostridium sp.]|jgi:hypothetical protein
MPDYKRIISYIYNYEDGKKKNNVGYARVEARNGQCKCTLHITAPSLNDRQLQVYIFKRKGGIEGILLGAMLIKAGNGEFKTITDSKHLMNSAYGLEDMSGILLYYTDRKFFATSWDDAPITLDMACLISRGQLEPKLRAAGIEKENKDNVEETEKTKEAAKDNIIKVNFNDSDESGIEVKSENSAMDNNIQKNPEKQEKVQEQKAESDDKEEPKKIAAFEQKVSENIMETDEYREPNEGEVYNDWEEDKDTHIRLSSQDTKESSFEKGDSKEDKLTENKASDNYEQNNREDKKDNKSYIEIPEHLRQELNTRVELLQKEDLTGCDKALSEKEEENSLLNQKAKSQESGSDLTAQNKKDSVFLETENKKPDLSDTEGKQKSAKPLTKEKDEMETNSFSENPQIHPDQKELRPESISPVLEESKKSSQEANVKQPFYEDHPIAKKIYLSYPRMYPFEDNDVAWCVRIEPQDIGLFPMESWILGNNSFLLHGYYSYRHLIFARLNDKNGVRYILGVPGIYHNREKFMARMFGFENFKCAKRKPQRTGEFGYWYIPITLN